MRVFIALIGFILFPFIVISQTGYYRITLNEQDDIEELIESPDVSQDTIEWMINQLLFQAKKSADRPQDLSSIQLLYNALRLEDKIKERGEVSYLLFHYTGDYVSFINPDIAIQFYHKARHVELTTDAARKVDFYILLTNMSGVFARMGFSDSAAYYYREALVQAKGYNETTYASALNNFGVFYYTLHKPDSALFYYNKALLHLNRDNDIILYCSILDNIAQLAVDKKQYEDALPVYLYNDSVYAYHDLMTRYTINRLKLISAYEKTGAQSIGGMYKDLERFIQVHKPEIKEAEVLNFYKSASDYFLKKGNIENHYYYLTSYRLLRDSIETKLKERDHLLTAGLLNLQAAALQKEIDFRQLQVVQQKKTLVMQRAIIVLSVLTSAIIITLLILYLRQRKKEHETAERAISAELKNKEMEAKLIQQELELKKKDLTNVVLQNVQVYDQNQKMIERLSSINGKERDIKDQIHSLILEIRTQNMVGDRAIAMQQQIDTVNAEFYDKLMTRYPELTKAEAELCGYIRINLSSKDIAVLKNVESNSVKMGKNRLRKKLGVEAFGDLYAVIQGL